MTSALSVAELYDRISAAEGSVGRTLRPGAAARAVRHRRAVPDHRGRWRSIAGFALAKSITGSVHALFTGTERVRQGDFTHKIAVQQRGSARRAGRRRSTR